MIRIERDPVFWEDVLSHPAVCHVLNGDPPSIVRPLLANPAIIPMASQHGGFIFVPLGHMGHVYELHTSYTPEGWGREVLEASKEAFNHIFETAQLITTFEVEDWKQSRPPLSFGFKPCGEFQDGPMGSMRSWILTRAAWSASPARSH